MAKSNHKFTLQQWLYITENSLCLFETGMGKNALPYLTLKAHIKSDDPLNDAKTLAPWVKQHANKTINLLIGNGLYQLLQSDVPDVPPEELDAAIELKASDLLSYDIDDAVMDVIQLPKEAYRGRMRMAFIIAMKKAALIDWQTELIHQGVRVKLIDVEVTAMRNLAVTQQNYSESGILHLQRDNSRLVLNFSGEMVLSRSFDIGLDSLISETTIDDDGLELTVNEDTQSEIQIESLVLEIRRSFDYYEAQLGLGAVAEMMFLCDEQQESLAMELAKRIGVRFVMLHPKDFAELNSTIEDIDVLQFYGLIGTLYREALS